MIVGTQDYGVTLVDANDANAVACRVWLPPWQAMAASAPLLIWSHPQGQDQLISPSYFAYPLIHAALQQGWMVVASNEHGGSSWGNSAVMTDLAAAKALAATYHPVGSVLLIGASMGGTATANAVAKGAVSGVVGAYLVDGAFDLSVMYAAAAYTSTVDTGYSLTRGTLSAATIAGATSLPTTAGYPTVGTQLLVGNGTANAETVTTTAASTGTAVAVTACVNAHASAEQVSDYPTKTAGWNPMQDPASAFTGIRWRFVASSADTTVVKSSHTDPFAAKVAAAPEAGVVSKLGTHLSVDSALPADMVAFAKRCGLT